MMKDENKKTSKEEIEENKKDNGSHMIIADQLNSSADFSRSANSPPTKNNRKTKLDDYNTKHEHKKEEKIEEHTEKEESKKENKDDDKKEKPKDKKVKKDEHKIKKEFAIARGENMHMSKKHGMYLCEFIKGKKIDDAIYDLGRVLKYKIAVPFRGEIPHRRGKGMMSGRYPIKASGMFINLLKALKGNSLVNGLDLDKTKIFFASANWGVRPARKNNRRGKRTHILLKAKEIPENGEVEVKTKK